MVDDHSVDLVLTHEEVLVSDGAVLRSVAVQGEGASRPEIGAEDVQVSDLLGVTRVELKEVFASLRHTLDL